MHAPQVAGRTPLHEAASMLHVECVKLLLKYNADPNKADVAGITPLLSAGDGPGINYEDSQQR